MTAHADDLEELLALLAETCPICATYVCAGHRPRQDCGQWSEVSERHDLGDHRYCAETGDPGSCEFADDLAADVLAAGLPHATDDRPLALVVLRTDGRPIYAGGTYADHRTAKPARTRAGGGGLAAKGRTWVVCGRCRALH